LQVHPVALYETILLILLLLLLLVLRKLNKMKGVILSVYLFGYGCMIFGMEFIRLDSQKIMGTRFSIEHIVAVVLALTGIIIFTDQFNKQRITRKAQPKNLNMGKKN